MNSPATKTMATYRGPSRKIRVEPVKAPSRRIGPEQPKKPVAPKIKQGR